MIDFSALTSQTKQLDNYIYNISSTENDFIGSLYKDSSFFKYDKNYCITNLLQFVNDYSQEVKTIKHNYYLTYNININNSLSDILDETEKYKSSVQLLIQRLHERGFLKYGLCGQLNSTLYNLNKSVSAIKNNNLDATLKDIYLLKDNYLHEPNPEILTLLVNEIDKARMILLSYNMDQSKEGLLYLKKVNDLAISITNKDVETGIIGNSGLIEKLNSNIEILKTKNYNLFIQIKKIINTSVFYATVHFLILLFIIICCLIFLFYIIFSSLYNPLQKIKLHLIKLDRGELPKPLNLQTSEEIIEVTDHLNEFIKSLKTKVEFAIEIGKGNHHIKYQPVSDDDILGNSLLEMSKSLLRAEIEDQKYKIEEKKRLWENEGIARFAEILRLNNDDLMHLSDLLITNLVKYLNANQGAFFLVKEDERSNLCLEMVSVFAYNRKKFIHKTVAPGEGLVGTCYLEKETIFLTDIPENYITIGSGLGDSKPKCVIIVPLKTEDTVLGIIEIASFTILDPHEINFVEKIAHSIASTIISVRINEQTTQLLIRSQKQTEEMAIKEEEMQQRMTELHNIQNESALKEAELNNFISSINDHSLIIHYDLRGKISYINHNFLLAFETEKQNLIGRFHKEFTSMDVNSDDYKKFWEDLKNGNNKIMMDKIKILKGKVLLVCQNFIPIFNNDGKITKILSIAFNVNEKNIQDL